MFRRDEGMSHRDESMFRRDDNMYRRDDSMAYADENMFYVYDNAPHANENMQHMDEKRTHLDKSIDLDPSHKVDLTPYRFWNHKGNVVDSTFEFSFKVPPKRSKLLTDRANLGSPRATDRSTTKNAQNLMLRRVCMASAPNAVTGDADLKNDSLTKSICSKLPHARWESNPASDVIIVSIDLLSYKNDFDSDKGIILDHCIPNCHSTFISGTNRAYLANLPGRSQSDQPTPLYYCGSDVHGSRAWLYGMIREADLNNSKMVMTTNTKTELNLAMYPLVMEAIMQSNDFTRTRKLQDPEMPSTEFFKPLQMPDKTVRYWPTVVTANANNGAGPCYAKVRESNGQSFIDVSSVWYNDLIKGLNERIIPLVRPVDLHTLMPALDSSRSSDGIEWDSNEGASLSQYEEPECRFTLKISYLVRPNLSFTDERANQ